MEFQSVRRSRVTHTFSPDFTSTHGPRISRLDLQQPDERRLVLLVENDHVEYTEASTAAEEQLLADLHPVRVGRFPDIGPVRKVEPGRSTYAPRKRRRASERCT